MIATLVITTAIATAGYLAWRGLSQPRTEPLPGQPGGPVAATVMLPVEATSPETLRSALQVRALIRSGRCDAALMTLRSIDSKDHAYAVSLDLDPAVQSCRQAVR